MDVKVTDFCNANCGFCHEQSTIHGNHGSLETGLKLFKDLPAGTEIAIGGGNPLAWPDLEQFTEHLSNQGVVCNMTVNSVHLRQYNTTIKRLCKNQQIHGLGISYNKANLTDCLKFARNHAHVVFHIIMGKHNVDDVLALMEATHEAKLLVLGYKEHGRGAAYYNTAVEERKYEWMTRIHEFFDKDGLVLSFDNLAIAQLKLRRLIPEETWLQFYMGDDGKFTMYVDLVKKEYASSSTSKNRHGLNTSDTTQSIFKTIRCA
jgi:organic radical activating enzyme